MAASLGPRPRCPAGTRVGGSGRRRAPAAELTVRVPASRIDLDAVVERLRVAGCVAAEDEADVLVGAAPDVDVLDRWLARRELGEPLAWIVGRSRFCGQDVHVAPGVYVPRWQSEELAVRGAALLRPRGRAVDLCTGSGAIAVHLAAAVPDATVVGADIDPLAVACARRNGVTAVVADLGSAFAPESFDVLTLVAPYVPRAAMALLPPDVRRHEPALALDGGDDGLDVVRRGVIDAGRLLRPGGHLVVEIGGDQLAAVEAALDAARFGEVDAWTDDDGDLRGVAARRR